MGNGPLCDTHTKSGDRVGSRQIRTITPRGADKLYQKMVIGPNGRRDRTAEKVVKLCRKAWRVLHRLFPDEFPKDVPNPLSPDRIRKRRGSALGMVMQSQKRRHVIAATTHSKPTEYFQRNESSNTLRNVPKSGCDTPRGDAFRVRESIPGRRATSNKTANSYFVQIPL